MIATTQRRARHGAAVVEFAVVLPLLLLFLLGIWEMGRAVEATHILSQAAREGARHASIGNYTLSTGTTIITVGAMPSPDPGTVTYAVKTFLDRMGYDTTGLEVEYYNKTQNAFNQPHEANKGDAIHVRVRVPFGNVRWTTTNLLVGAGVMISSGDYGDAGVWASMKDDPFTLNADIASGYPHAYPHRGN